MLQDQDLSRSGQQGNGVSAIAEPAADKVGQGHLQVRDAEVEMQADAQILE
jgi:hypothetical protein